jgi:hypothetical protein
MPPRQYGCDKFIIALVVLIVVCFVALWYWGSRSDISHKQPMHTEAPNPKSSVPKAPRSRFPAIKKTRFAIHGGFEGLFIQPLPKTYESLNLM